MTLAIAGCASTNVQESQTSAGDKMPRPKVVIVNDFTFSPDVTVVDRDFIARLEKKFGNYPTGDIVKTITERRVNDEIVASVIVHLHYDAGLNAQPNSDVEGAPKNNMLVITGELHAIDSRHPQRNANFGPGVVADIAVSQVSQGTKKQLIAFTAGTQDRLQIMHVAAVAQSDEIAAVLAAKSSPDISLSPSVEAQAREFGRAIADKIVAYAMQQGWVNKADLPEPPPILKPAAKKVADKRPKESPVPVAKQDGSQRNTIPCDAFTKNERGNWYVKGPVTFDLGSAENKTLQNLEIPPKFFTIGGVDLYEAIQKKCAGNQR